MNNTDYNREKFMFALNRSKKDLETLVLTLTICVSAFISCTPFPK